MKIGNIDIISLESVGTPYLRTIYGRILTGVEKIIHISSLDNSSEGTAELIAAWNDVSVTNENTVKYISVTNESKDSPTPNLDSIMSASQLEIIVKNRYPSTIEHDDYLSRRLREYVDSLIAKNVNTPDIILPSLVYFLLELIEDILSENTYVFDKLNVLTSANGTLLITTLVDILINISYTSDIPIEIFYKDEIKNSKALTTLVEISMEILGHNNLQQ